MSNLSHVKNGMQILDRVSILLFGFICVFISDLKLEENFLLTTYFFFCSK